MTKESASSTQKSTQNLFFLVCKSHFMFLSLYICKSKTDFGSQGFNYFLSRCMSEIFFQILLKLKGLPQNRIEHT